MILLQLKREDYIRDLLESLFGRRCMKELGLPNRAMSLETSWSRIQTVQNVYRQFPTEPVLFLYDAPVFVHENAESLALYQRLVDSFGADFETLTVPSNIGLLYVVNVLRTERMMPEASPDQTGYSFKGTFSGRAGLFRLQALPELGLYVADDESNDSVLSQLGETWGVRYREMGLQD